MTTFDPAEPSAELTAFLAERHLATLIRRRLLKVCGAAQKPCLAVITAGWRHAYLRRNANYKRHSRVGW